MEPAPPKKEPAPVSKPAAGRTKKPPPRPRPKPKPVLAVDSGPKALRMEVVIRTSAIAAFMLGKRDREIAVRVWEMNPAEGGIVRHCDCEKGTECKANGVIIRPVESQFLEKQMQEQLYEFAWEYNLARQKIHYNRVSYLSGEPVPAGRFELFGMWKNEETINEAQDTFARLYWKR